LHYNHIQKFYNQPPFHHAFPYNLYEYTPILSVELFTQYCRFYASCLSPEIQERFIKKRKMGIMKIEEIFAGRNWIKAAGICSP